MDLQAFRRHALVAACLAMGAALMAPQLAGASVSFWGSSADGSRAFFTTDDQLVGGDTDTQIDVYERSGHTTTLLSQGGINGNGAFSTTFRGVSVDGNHVFFSSSERLASADVDNNVDLYERSAGTTTLVSQGQINGNGAFDAGFAGLATDGSRVFFSTSEQLVAMDTDASRDIYERSAGTTTLVSQGEINGNGAFDAANGNFRFSADGSRAVFATGEQLVATDSDASQDIYERSAVTTSHVSQGDINGNGAFPVELAHLSADGSHVFFFTNEQLATADADMSRDLYERSAGTTTLVSRGQINGNGAFDVGNTVFSSTDGSRVFFYTSEQLVSADSDASQDLYERSAGTTTLVTQGQINGNGAFTPGVLDVDSSADGSRVFFTTSEQLVAGDSDGVTDIYERSGGTTTRVSQGQINGSGGFHVGFAGASSDGTQAFFRTSEQLVTVDTDASRDVYERSGGTTTLISQGQMNGNGAFDVDPVTNGGVDYFSSDGSHVFFTTAEQLVGDDNDDQIDIYDRSGGTTRLISKRQPPQTSVSGPAGATSDSTPTFTFTSDNPNASFECRVDQADFDECSGPGAAHTPAPLSDGQHVFEVRAIGSDAVADPSPATRVFVVDTLDPQTTVDAGPAGATSDSTPTFAFASSDAGSSFQCQIDDGPLGTCSGPGATHTPAAPLAEGPHSFSVVATDPASNVDDSAATRAFTIDTLPPEVSVVSGPSGPNRDTTPTFTFSSDEAGSTFRCRIDSGAFGACSGPGSSHTTAALAEGAHVFRVRATDAAGNTDTERRSFAVDVTPPDTVINSGPSGTTTDRTPTFSFSAVPASGATFQCKVDSGSFVSCSSPRTTSTLSVGTHTFRVRARDAAGNLDPTPAIRSFKVQ